MCLCGKSIEGIEGLQACIARGWWVRDVDGPEDAQRVVALQEQRLPY